MFTGIIDHCGTIKTIKKTNDTLIAWIDCQYHDLILGESIAVDGICLTVVECAPGSFRCDLSSETCHLTTAQHYLAGQQVNIERAMRTSDRIGGHFVTGHIDQRAQVALIGKEQDFIEMSFNGIAADLASQFLIVKGCITVNGVSLTINEVVEDGFKVMLIPHTLERTNLKNLQVNAVVNLEFDWMVKIVAQQVQHIQQHLTNKI